MNGIIHSITMFMRRAVETQINIPEYGNAYEKMNNQGNNLSDYLITVHEVRPGIWEGERNECK